MLKTTLPGSLFPFGPDAGDQVLDGDDSASPSQTHTFDYPFYGTSYSTLFVSLRRMH